MTPEPIKNSVVAAFDAAADAYDSWTQVQRDVARAVVSRAVGQARAPKLILDLGAGTGHVTELALQHWPEAELTALDASPAMLARLQIKFPGVQTVARDASKLDGLGRYDLILSSMMLHWLDDPRAALTAWREHLAPGGLLCVAAPVAGSLPEWRALTREARIEDRMWAFPRPDFAEGLGAESEIIDFPATYADARTFLRSIKGAGAHRARPGAEPAPPGALRRLLAERKGAFTATFRIVLLTLSAD